MAEVGRVLIVGGGIGGLSLATALHRRGLAAEVVERSPAWPALGRGSRCTPTGCGCCAGSGWGRRSAETVEAALRERGDQLLRDRYRPLVAMP